MKKMMMVLVFGLVSLASAQQEWISFTGRVIKARAGQEGATFYTLQQNDTGKKYEANTRRPDVSQNEAVIKEALESGRTVYIEFNIEDKWPDAVWRIRKIKLLDTTDQPVILG
jgi:hypothetical protein